MKRSPQLQPLSHDHYEGLQMATRVRRELRDPQAIAALVEDVVAFWHAHLVPHFEAEEALILPVLRDGAPDLGERMVAEHRAIRALVEAVAGADPASTLADFAQALKDHIRFEEREAFPAAERLATPAQLEAIARDLHDRGASDPAP